ncbi:MAG: alpha/beta hydrolase [Pseudomonadota bacterium]
MTRRGVFFVFLAVAALLSTLALGLQQPPAPPGRFVEADGVRMHVVELGAEHKGAAPSVVMIHGASANLRDMAMALGAPLAVDRHVILVDRPGHGYSDRPPDGRLLARQAQLVRDAATAAGADRPVVVGQSLGGAVALAYALAFQDEMSGLVALAPVSHEWPGGVAWYNHVATTPIVGAAFRALVIRPYGRFVVPRTIARAVAPNAMPDDYFRRAGVGLLFYGDRFRHNAEDIVALKPQIVAMQSRYGALRLPIRVAAGLDDKDVYPDIHARALAAEAPNATLTLFENTGHALHHARTDEILKMIRGLSARDGD